MKLKDIWATIQTFSLDEDSFPVILDNVALLLRTLTINIYKNNVTSISLVYYVVTIAAGICYFYVYIFSMLWLLFFRYSVSENFIEMAIAISLTSASITSIIKLMSMIIHLKSIRETVEKLLIFDEQISLGARFVVNLRKNLRVVKKRALVIWTFLVVNATLFALVPFLRPGRHFAQDSYIIYGLEPMYESPNYEIIQCMNTTSVAFCVYVMVNIAAYLIVVVGYNEAQLFTLTEEINYLWADSQNLYNALKHKIRNKIHAVYIKDKIINEYIRFRLRTIIEQHVTNIYLFKELNTQLSNTLAIEYIIMSVAIISELLGGLDRTYLQVSFSAVLISIDCLSGQRLIDACNEFEKAMYNCEWEKFDVSNQKTVLLMLLNSQKTLMLSAGGMASLNFSCLMMVLRSSYSAYTTLKSSIQH